MQITPTVRDLGEGCVWTQEGFKCVSVPEEKRVRHHPNRLGCQEVKGGAGPSAMHLLRYDVYEHSGREQHSGLQL